MEELRTCLTAINSKTPTELRLCVRQCIRCPIFPALGKALVSTLAQAAITNTTGREGLNNRHIPHSSGGQVHGECACMASSAESPLPGYSREAERGGSDLSPRMRTPIPPWGPSSWFLLNPVTSQRPQLLIPPHRGYAKIFLTPLGWIFWSKTTTPHRVNMRMLKTKKVMKTGQGVNPSAYLLAPTGMQTARHDL